MSWWSTLAGGALGFMIGGPIGALIGASLGSSFSGRTQYYGADPAQHHGSRQRPGSRREQAQAAFFLATFSVMGHVAKADGRVTADEIRLANRVMDELGLNRQQRQAARALFDQGKANNFPLDDVLEQLRTECLRGTNIRRMFLEIQFQAAWADGGIHRDERRLLRRIAARLGLSDADFVDLERLMSSRIQGRVDGPSLDDAYATLGVSSNAPDAEVKRAYRRLMSRHHPDKLAAKGLPDEMMRSATERTQQIKAAWDTVKASRAA